MEDKAFLCTNYSKNGSQMLNSTEAVSQRYLCRPQDNKALKYLGNVPYRGKVHVLWAARNVPRAVPKIGKCHRSVPASV